MKALNSALRILVVVCCLQQQTSAQEILAKVNIITSRISTQVDKRIFTTLQNQLANLINNRKWTEDNFKTQEKIQVNFILNLDKELERNVYGGSLVIQAARPAYNSSYNSPLINWQDNDVVFKYVEFQPVEFNESRLSGTDGLVTNLPAIFAYYTYMILGFDYDSFAANGGEPFFKKALFIVNNSPQGRGISGWSQFDGLRNRWFLAENTTNTRFALMHDAIYQYYRNSLDNFYESENASREALMNVLNVLNTFASNNQNTMIMQFFMQSKSDEIIFMLQKGSGEMKARAITMLQKIDVTNAEKYREKLK
jgi:hypothetical protein